MTKTIWTLVEVEYGRPARSSLEVLSKAAKLGRAEAMTHPWLKVLRRIRGAMLRCCLVI